MVYVVGVVDGPVVLEVDRGDSVVLVDDDTDDDGLGWMVDVVGNPAVVDGDVDCGVVGRTVVDGGGLVAETVGGVVM
jgi:hypothetical protein